MKIELKRKELERLYEETRKATEKEKQMKS